MSIGDLIQLLTAATAAIGAVGSVVAMLLGLRNSKKITEVHLLINSKMTDLLILTRESSTAEGVLEGRAQIRQEMELEKKKEP